jgi:hypothetical protein
MEISSDESGMEEIECTAFPSTGVEEVVVVVEVADADVGVPMVLVFSRPYGPYDLAPGKLQFREI